MKSTYRNPWHKADGRGYGPAFYVTDAKPIAYRGYLIFERIKHVCFDVVRAGTCVTQRAGINGARQFIDALPAKSR